VIIYSLRPVSIRSDSAQRKTNPKSEMTHYVPQQRSAKV